MRKLITLDSQTASNTGRKPENTGGRKRRGRKVREEKQETDGFQGNEHQLS